MITFLSRDVSKALEKQGRILVDDRKTLKKWMRDQNIKIKLSNKEIDALLFYNSNDYDAVLAMDDAGQLYFVKYESVLYVDDQDHIIPGAIKIKRSRQISFYNLCTLALAHCREDVRTFAGEREEAMCDETFEEASDGMFNAERNKEILSALVKRIKKEKL